jgi:hypothetical protein
MLRLKSAYINIQSRCPPNPRFEQVLKKEKGIHTIKARSQYYGLETRKCWMKAERGLAAHFIFYLKMGLADCEGMAGRPLTSARWTSAGLRRAIEPHACADKIGTSGLFYR